MQTEPDARSAREDEWIAVRCQLGEAEGLEDLITRWNAPLGRYLRHLVGDDEAAKDVAQDVWLRVLRGIGRLRDGSKLRPWLFGVARRTVMDRLRVKYRTPAPATIDTLDVAVEDPPEDRHAGLDALEVELARLPVTEREVLTLFYLQELTLTDVAEILGVPVGTVKSRLHRARRLLREELNKGDSRP
ncbi:MAG: sigma-70 family RNA polymerase sigma factor [Acidobacteria bacterium]|nr:sigma-70 family RNA polymerase sigma factor [Acidobacteriota bacterium]